MQTQTPNAEQVAKQFGCTVAQAKAQFAANAKQLQKLADKAAATGKKANGQTAAYWAERAEAFAKAAA